MLRKLTIFAAFAAMVPIGFMPPQASACPRCAGAAVAANANVAVNANAVIGVPAAVGVPVGVVPLGLVGINTLSPRAQRINERQTRRQTRRCGGAAVGVGVTANAVVGLPQAAPAQPAPTFEIVPDQSNLPVQEAPAPADATVQEKSIAGQDIPVATPEPAPVLVPAPALIPVPSRVSFDVPVYTQTYQAQTYRIRMVADPVPVPAAVSTVLTYSPFVMPTYSYRYLAYTGYTGYSFPMTSASVGFGANATVVPAGGHGTIRTRIRF